MSSISCWKTDNNSLDMYVTRGPSWKLSLRKG